MEAKMMMVPVGILESKHLSPNAKLFWMYLYKKKNQNMLLTQEEMARELGKGSKSVYRYIKELKEHGYLVVSETNTKQAYDYELVLP